MLMLHRHEGKNIYIEKKENSHSGELNVIQIFYLGPNTPEWLQTSRNWPAEIRRLPASASVMVNETPS